MKKTIIIGILTMCLILSSSCDNHIDSKRTCKFGLSDFKIFVETGSNNQEDYTTKDISFPEYKIKKSVYIDFYQIFPTASEKDLNPEYIMLQYSSLYDNTYQIYIENRNVQDGHGNLIQPYIDVVYDQDLFNTNNFYEVYKKDSPNSKYYNINIGNFSEIDEGYIINEINGYTVLYYVKNGVIIHLQLCTDGIMIIIDTLCFHVDKAVARERWEKFRSDDRMSPISALFSENTETRDAAFYKIVSAVQNRPYKDVQ